MLPKFSDIKIAVIVALAEEYETFIRYFSGRLVEKFHIDETVVDILESDAGVRLGLVCLHRMGNVGAAVATTRLFQVFNLDVVVNLGLAAGTDSKKQKLGDVIIAENIRYYESGKLTPSGLSVAPEYSSLHSTIFEQIQKEVASGWPLGTSVGGRPRQVFFGTVASGEKVIGDAGFVSTLLAMDRKTVGIEMESYGISAAIRGRNEKLLLIRGISDFADQKKNDHSRLSAMEGSVRFFDQALRRNLLTPQKSFHVPEIVSFPVAYSLYVAKRKVASGIPHIWVEVKSLSRMDEFRKRRALIQKISQKFSLEELRVFCIALKIDFDELRGSTKTEKAASLLDYVERKKILTLELLDALIDEEG